MCWSYIRPRRLLDQLFKRWGRGKDRRNDLWPRSAAFDRTTLAPFPLARLCVAVSLCPASLSSPRPTRLVVTHCRKVCSPNFFRLILAQLTANQLAFTDHARASLPFLLSSSSFSFSSRSTPFSFSSLCSFEISSCEFVRALVRK